MYQNEYHSMNKEINPRDGLNREVLEKALPRRRTRFRPAAVVAAVLVIALMAVPVMATAVPWILEIVAPQLTEKLEPVQRSVTNNGIIMEVVGASVRGNVAELVVRIEGEALKAAVGVAPSLVTNREGLESGRFHSILDYEGVEEDRANGIYYYQIMMMYRPGMSLEEILAGEMTVTLEDIVLSSGAYDDVSFPITPVESDEITRIKLSDLEEYGFNSFGCENIQDCKDGCDMEHEVIFPCEEMVYQVTEELGITCIAYVDGMLHIQMKMVTGDRYKESAFCAPYLEGADGNEKLGLIGYQYNRDDGTSRLAYGEYIFAVSPEELENYTIHLDYSYTIHPQCEVTFHFTEDEVEVN